MVVEDDDDLRSLVSELLEAEGYAVVTARDGIAALARLDREPLPRLILLDLMMPRMNGQEFLQRRRVNPVLSKIPVVLTTASGTPPPADDLLAVLTKPLDLPILLATVQAVCGEP